MIHPVGEEILGREVELVAAGGLDEAGREAALARVHGLYAVIRGGTRRCSTACPSSR